MKTSGVGVLITKVSATGERNIMDDPVACDAIKTLVEGGYTGDDVMKAWKAKEMFIGKRFLIMGDHPHAGKVAECIAFEKVAFGEIRPRMRSDDGDEFFVLEPQNWKMLKDGRGPRGGAMIVACSCGVRR